MVQPLWSLILQLSILFIDNERETIQDLCAIQMSVVTRQIVDVYHAHAVCHNHDDWVRDHISKTQLTCPKTTWLSV